MKVYGVTNHTMQKLQRMVREGLACMPDKRFGRWELSCSASRAVQFMETFFKDNCDVMPHPDGNKELRHLPHTYTR